MFGAIPIDARPNEELDKTRAVLQRMTGVPVGAAGESGLKPMMALPTMEECMEAVRKITGLDNVPSAADNSSDRTTIAVLIAERDSWKERAHKAEYTSGVLKTGCEDWKRSFEALATSSVPLYRLDEVYSQLNAMRARAEAAEAKLTTREASLHRATGARFNPPGSIGGP